MTSSKPVVLVQYIALRKDLLTALHWPVGALVAQACHASSAVLHLHRDDPDTQAYLALVDCMHKVVLEIENEADLRKLSAELHKNDILHKMWVEQPEDTPTCLATKPYPKPDVQRHFKKFKLFS